eukprot:m.86213 g.86213  ORF g.86213 m.86213 type:complete len:57 (-) comp25944_c0_seq1:246-416(-)
MNTLTNNIVNLTNMNVNKNNSISNRINSTNRHNSIQIQQQQQHPTYQTLARTLQHR